MGYIWLKYFKRVRGNILLLMIIFQLKEEKMVKWSQHFLILEFPKMDQLISGPFSFKKLMLITIQAMKH